VKAMVLAAGVGERLRPFTLSTPKPLLEVGGEPLLRHVLRRLKRAGVTEVIVNLFHLGERIAEWLASQRELGLRIELSREAELLDTGGGLKRAAWFFDDGRPFFLHNADVLSEIDLSALYRFHREAGGLATLAVQARPGTRQLLFDGGGRLCGRESPEGVTWARRPAGEAARLGFTGIHVIDPALFPRLTETGRFPIIQSYLRLVAAGERIVAFRADGSYWQDVGTAEKLEAARRRAGGAAPFPARGDRARKG